MIMQEPLEVYEYDGRIRIEDADGRRFYIPMDKWNEFIKTLKTSSVPDEFIFADDLKVAYSATRFSFWGRSEAGYFDKFLELSVDYSHNFIEEILGCKHEQLSA